jgi:DNA-binding transcriptional LysR family regulator
MPRWAFAPIPQGGSLNLAILPTFGTRWLAPRLPQFFSAHPGITINLTTRLSQFDFQLEAVDAAIHFGLPNWPGAELEFLMSETVVPACSPDVAARHGFARPEDLLRAPLLHLASRPDAWQRWFGSQGARADMQGMLFDQFATAAQAAIAGVGVALLPKFLIQRELAQGDLVQALPHLPEVESAERYYLAWPTSRGNYPPLQSLREWLQQAAQDLRDGPALTPAAPATSACSAATGNCPARPMATMAGTCCCRTRALMRHAAGRCARQTEARSTGPPRSAPRP